MSQADMAVEETVTTALLEEIIMVFMTKNVVMAVETQAVDAMMTVGMVATTTVGTIGAEEILGATNVAVTEEDMVALDQPSKAGMEPR